MRQSQWKLIFVLLSLDGVVPFYDEMGLQVSDKQQFVEVLRRLIIKDRSIYEKIEDVESSLVPRAMGELKTLFTQRSADHFYTWATTVFCWAPSDQAQWSAWQIVLLYEDELRKHVLLSPQQYEVISRLRKSLGADDIAEHVATLKSQPLTEWDSETYSVNNFSNVDDPFCETDFIDPYSIVLSTVEMNRFQSNWGDLLSSLTAEEKMQLWTYGQQMMTAQNVSLPEPLYHPDSLRRQI
jgi:hypothetical protein